MISRRNYRRWSAFLCVTSVVLAGVSFAQSPADEVYGEYTESVAGHLQRLYDPAQRTHTFRDDYPGGFEKWKTDWRDELTRLLGMNQIAADNKTHSPKVEVGETEDLGAFTRAKCTIETEPHVRIPFWLLRPQGDGPFPVALLPHGHDSRGYDTTAGVYHDEAHRRKSIEEDRNVGVQAVERNFLAIAPATRGLAVDGVPDRRRRHGGSNCRSQLMHCLAAGRTAMGERVWDMQRLLDWALALPEADAQRVLVMGNSGGGMVTLYTSAVDERIKVAVPSCSFCSIASPTGYLYHCDCNLVPGILRRAEMCDVAGLTAPRHMLVVNGREDGLFAVADVQRAAAQTKAIFAAAGCADHFEHRFGAAGHRFYADLMWPFVMKALDIP